MTNVEMIWAKILLTQGEILLFGSFYRPLDSNDTPMEEFEVFYHHLAKQRILSIMLVIS